MQGHAQRWLIRLLAALLPEDVAEPLVGDLLEERELRVRTSGARRAALWYWSQVARSVAPLASIAFRRGNWVPAWVVGFVAFSFAASVEVAARATVTMVATHTGVDAVPVLLLYLGAIALAACAAERLRAGSGIALALLVALTAVLGLADVHHHGMPLWYRLAFLLAGPPVALAGYVLFTSGPRGAPTSRGRSGARA